MFIIKKLLTPFCSPFFTALVLLLVGLVLLWFSPKRQRLGRLLTTIAAVSLILFSYAPISDFFLGSLERRYAPLMAPGSVRADIKWVVVLGAGHSADPAQPPTNQLNGAALARLVEGIRLLRELPQAKLLLSGAPIFDKTSHASALAGAAEALGVPRARLVLEEESQDTGDQARIVRRMIGDDPFVLVTSANHMPRSVGLFVRQGMRPIAAPTDILADPGNGFDPSDLFPNPNALFKADAAFHEYAGMLFSKLRGQM